MYFLVHATNKVQCSQAYQSIYEKANFLIPVHIFAAVFHYTCR